MPMAIPRAAIKKDTGRTTLMAAMPKAPIQFPTKIESTSTLSDMTRIPIEAGTACFTSSGPMGCVPKAAAEILDIGQFAGGFPLRHPIFHERNPGI